MPTLKKLIVLVLILLAPIAQADEKSETPLPEEGFKKSLWIFSPVFSSDPKLSTSGGAMAGYVHHFDEVSPPSIFGLTGVYSTTSPWYVAAFAQTFFGHWYLGPQIISADYIMSGDNAFSGELIELVGLTGFRSNGLDLLVQYDTRDNQYSPASGQVFKAFNVAFRESFGGDDSFDMYVADYQYYIAHGNGHVLALHANGSWTVDAPPSGYSSVDIRGYTNEQYIVQNMAMAELDERYLITKKFGLAAFAGVAYLYGDDAPEGSEALYPSGGLGAFYQLNDEKMVVHADFAFGKSGNRGFNFNLASHFKKIIIDGICA